MTVSGKKISQYPSLTTPSANTRLVVSHNGVTYNVTTPALLSNTGPITLSNTSSLSVNNFIIRRGDTPANSTIASTEGQIWFDDNYLYVAVANNQLKRVALVSF